MSKSAKIGGTEVKFGLAVIGILLLVLAMVLLKRVVGPQPMVTTSIDDATEFQQGADPRKLGSLPTRQTVLKAQAGESPRPYGEPESRGSQQWATAGADNLASEDEAPSRHNFMPKLPVEPADRDSSRDSSRDSAAPGNASVSTAGAEPISPVPAEQHNAERQHTQAEPPTLVPAFITLSQTPSPQTALLPTRTDLHASESRPSANFSSVARGAHAREAEEALVEPAIENSTEPPTARFQPNTDQESHTHDFTLRDRYGQITSPDGTNADPSQRTFPNASQQSYRNLRTHSQPPINGSVEPNVSEGLPVSSFGAPQIAPSSPTRPRGTHLVEPGDSMWVISQRIYGTGAFFRAIAEYNRQRHPLPHRLSIGDEILTPAVEVLRKKYPHLCPQQRKRKPGVVSTAPISNTMVTGSRNYLVEEGDTLYDIARYELGSGKRWTEIYQLNRRTLGDDYDYLRPGTKLRLPGRSTSDSVTRRRLDTVPR